MAEQQFPGLGCQPDCVLRIIHINDIYSMENMARFKTCVDALRTPNTIVTCGGDFVAPSLLSAIDKGRGMVDIMNRTGIQYVCLGNHEANITFEELLKRANESTFTWIVTNMPDLLVEGRKQWVDHVVVEAKGASVTRKVGLLGLLSDDVGCFPLKGKGIFGGAKILSPFETSQKYAEQLKDKVDSIVVLDHLYMPEDRKLAKMKLGFPIALGGHDHDLYHEILDGQHIFKVGMDAQYIGVVDLVWARGEPKPLVYVQVHECKAYTPDPEIEKRVAEHLTVVEKLQGTRLAAFPAGVQMSSAGMRNGPNTMGTFLCTAGRDAMGVECCFVAATNLRGSSTYPLSHAYFTYGDMLEETPTDFVLVWLHLPGKVIADTILYSRTNLINNRLFLHMDNEMIWDPEKKALTHIAGKPLDLNRRYDVTVPYNLLTEKLPPLRDWAAANPDEIPRDPEAGMRFQEAVVAYWNSAIWLQLARLPEMDKDGKGILTVDDIRAGLMKIYGTEAVAELMLANLLACADLSGDGTVSVDEMLRATVKGANWHLAPIESGQRMRREDLKKFLETVMGDAPTDAEVELIFTEMDADHNDLVCRHEVHKWVSTNRAKKIGFTAPGQSDLLIA